MFFTAKLSELIEANKRSISWIYLSAYNARTRSTAAASLHWRPTTWFCKQTMW